MNRRVLKYPVVAALFSAAFLFGVSPADCYTYNGATTSSIRYDSSDLVVTGKSNIKVGRKLNANPKFDRIENIMVPYTEQTINSYEDSGWTGNLQLQYQEFYRSDGYTKDNVPYFKNIKKTLKSISPTINENSTETELAAFNKWIQDVNKMLKKIPENKNIGTALDKLYVYKENGKLRIRNRTDGATFAITEFVDGTKFTGKNDSYDPNTGYGCYDSWTRDDVHDNGDSIYVAGLNGYSIIVDQRGDWTSSDTSKWFKYDEVFEVKQGTYTPWTTTTEKVLHSIIVSDNSSLWASGNIQCGKDIRVTDNSHLKAESFIKAYRDIYSDKSIISTSNDQGESIITPGDITAEGAIKSDTYIGAVSGAITGNTVYSGGNIESANSIKAGGKAKGNVLNVGVINASSATITGNQSISGIFTTSGQAKLNGGAKLNNKKITGLSAGTLTASSTEAVNGAQLNTIKQKLATTGVGKTYTAGSDIAISSSNAISISKTGVVKSGNTGIVTGGTVYTETNSLNTKLNGLKDLVNSHQTTISSLQQQMGDLNQTISDINSNVASATSNLSNQLKNCLKSDMGNLSAAGRTAIKTIVSDSLKSMGRQSSQTLTSPVATFAAPDVKDTVNSKDVESVHDALTSKLDKSALSDITSTVDANTKQIGVNTDNIHANASSIETLQSGKSEVSGSNIDTTAYASKLGIGNVAKGDTGLVSGDTVYGALAGKADIGYVDSGIGMMENQMEGIKQQATHDMNRVGAGASALAGLHPSAYDASDKLSFASGYGHYKNANTSALGAFYHPNEKTMISVAGTIGNNDAMLSAGVSIKVGMSDHVDKVMVTPKMFSTQQVNNEQIQNRVEGQRNRLDEIERTLSAMMR